MVEELPFKDAPDGTKAGGNSKEECQSLTYKKHDDFNAFTYNQTGFRIEGNMLHLSKIGSNNRRKAKRMLARLYERINNKRRDFLHKLSTYYSSRYDLLFLERLKVMNMAKDHRLARRILDASWYTFKQMLQYKANRVVEVELAHSSIDCSRCNHPVPKSLAVRIHSCPRCGVVFDRDYNSAINHLKNGLKRVQLPVERREVTPVEIAMQSLKQEAHE